MAGKIIYSEKERALAVALLNSTLMARLGVRAFPADVLDTVWLGKDVMSLVACDNEQDMLGRASSIIEGVLPRVKLRLDPIEEKC